MPGKLKRAKDKVTIRRHNPVAREPHPFIYNPNHFRPHKLVGRSVVEDEDTVGIHNNSHPEVANHCRKEER